MKIREFRCPPKEFVERPDEVYTAKQKLMYGEEFNKFGGGGTKSAPQKRKRRGFADMIRLKAGVAATAGVVTVSALAAEPDIPGIPDDADRPGVSEPDFPFVPPGDHDVPDNPDTPGTPDILPEYKYSYTISYPTYSVDFSKGEYLIYFDISTERKKQAFYDYSADMICEFMDFFKEYGDEFEDDEFIHVILRSETEDINIRPGGYASYPMGKDIVFPNYIECKSLFSISKCADRAADFSADDGNFSQTYFMYFKKNCLSMTENMPARCVLRDTKQALRLNQVMTGSV